MSTAASVLPPRGEKHAWAPFALVDGLQVCDPSAPGELGTVHRGSDGRWFVAWDDQCTDDVQRRDDGAWVTDYGVELALVAEGGA